MALSTLSSLLRQVEQKDKQLFADLVREVKALSARREFGLNFERHIPETVELPGRPIRKGDKVRFLVTRGRSDEMADRRLWKVTAVKRTEAGRIASLMRQDDPHMEVEACQRAVEDLVVVAEFRDPIYPGLTSTGKVERGGGKPFHTVLNAENFHALQALLFAHEGQVDAIYIDPPYNTGASDWRYNNDYVDESDLYRHSKWLAFMERRLKLARRLLKPDGSVLIVTIDDKEVHRLALLLEQVFLDAKIQMVTSVINPRGKYRANEFARCEEYLFFVTLGNAALQGERDEDFLEGATVPWRTFRRSDASSARGTSKGGTGQFFPIYIDREGRVDGFGDPLPHDSPRTSAPARSGCTAVFPIRDDGTEMNWGLTASSARKLLDKGYLRVGRATPDKPQAYEISYLTSGRIADIETGRAVVVGQNSDGSVLARYVTHKIKMPVSTWNRPSHNAEVNGTELLKTMLGEKSFPYPKSLYAVEDALRLFVGNNPDALVLDFFAGSGTTAHAVMRLNRQDEGRRRSISVTNNEVSLNEQASLRKERLRPGDPAWEARGICEYITKPRLRAAVMGQRVDGLPLPGDYKSVTEFPMAEGFLENVEFFSLTYEAPRAVAHNLVFKAVAPLLWIKAGSQGRRIEEASDTFEIADTYGILFDLDYSREFLKDLGQSESLRMVFVVTDDERAFQMVCSELPSRIEAVRLYESYLTNFVINMGRD